MNRCVLRQVVRFFLHWHGRGLVGRGVEVPALIHLANIQQLLTPGQGKLFCWILFAETWHWDTQNTAPIGGGRTSQWFDHFSRWWKHGLCGSTNLPLVEILLWGSTTISIGKRLLCDSSATPIGGKIFLWLISYSHWWKDCSVINQLLPLVERLFCDSSDTSISGKIVMWFISNSHGWKDCFLIHQLLSLVERLLCDSSATLIGGKIALWLVSSPIRGKVRWASVRRKRSQMT